MQAENKNYIVAIDLGSGSVTAAAGSKDPDGRLNIIDMVSKPMQGMSCGEVINIEQVTGAVRAAVGELEEHLGIKVTEAYAGISGHVSSAPTAPTSSTSAAKTTKSAKRMSPSSTKA